MVCLVLQILLMGLQLGLLFFAGYLVLLTFAARKAAQQTRLPDRAAVTRFLILIPAHNEEKLIAQTLQNLSELEYPKALYAVYLVADNCSDRTAEIAAQAGAVVYERTDTRNRGKGYALQWLMEIIWTRQIAHDAVMIMDADSTLSPNFLRVMDAKIRQGERAIQAYYSVHEPNQSVTAGLRYAALTLVHYVRPLGRMVLGGSTGLKGNGMVFAAALFRQMKWSASITEDIDQHMDLVMAGERVGFAPDAVVYGEMPDTLDASESQVARWESGRVQMARRHVGPLLRQSWAAGRGGDGKRAYLLFDAAMEHLIPPFSVFCGAAFALLAVDLGAWLAVLFSGAGRTGLCVWAALNLAAGALLLGCLLFYLLSGLKLARAPRSVYLNFLYAPRFVVWKIRNYIQILFGKTPTDWVRTARNQSKS